MIKRPKNYKWNTSKITNGLLQKLKIRLVIKLKLVPLQHKTKSNMAYLNRVFDLRLKAHLKAMGAVLIERPKWCGKTTTAKQLANSVISLQDTDHREEYLATAITQ